MLKQILLNPQADSGTAVWIVIFVSIAPAQYIWSPMPA